MCECRLFFLVCPPANNMKKERGAEPWQNHGRRTRAANNAPPLSCAPSAPRLDLEAEGAEGIGLARPPRIGAVVPRHAEPLERLLERGAVEAGLAEAAHVLRVEQRVALDQVDELARRAPPVVVHLLGLEREQLEAAARVGARLGGVRVRVRGSG